MFGVVALYGRIFRRGVSGESQVTFSSTLRYLHDPIQNFSAFLTSGTIKIIFGILWKIFWFQNAVHAPTLLERVCWTVVSPHHHPLHRTQSPLIDTSWQLAWPQKKMWWDCKVKFYCSIATAIAFAVLQFTQGYPAARQLNWWWKI